MAQLGTDAAHAGQFVAVVCAKAAAAQRLANEIAWFAPALRIAVLPDWETLPYDHFSPHQDLVSERLATLYRASRGECDVLLVAATTALHRLAPPSSLAGFTFFLAQGETLDVDALRAQLALAGYQNVTQVVSPGEFSIRGGLIDLFPMGSPLPYRIDLFDQDIETIRTFDVDTQRTVYPVSTVRLLPAREFPLDDAGRARFRSRFREVFEGDPSRSPLYKDISSGVIPAGIEYYLPLFFEKTATLGDYLPAGAAVILHGDIPAAIAHFWQDTESRYRLLRGDSARPLLPPAELFVPEDEFNRILKPFSRVQMPTDATDSVEPDASEAAPGTRRARPLTEAVPSVQVDRRATEPAACIEALCDLDARARAHRRRKPRPARNHAAVFRRVRIQAVPGGRLGVVFSRAMRALPSRSARCIADSSGPGPTSRWSPKPSSTPMSRAARASARDGAAMSMRCCATFPKCASEIPTCMSSTESAAISA